MVETPFVHNISVNFTKHEKNKKSPQKIYKKKNFRPTSMFFVCEEIDSTDGNSNAGLSEALGDQNIHTLQNQVEYIISK
jgi:hypothetical protein